MAVALPVTLGGRLVCPEHDEQLEFSTELARWQCPAGHWCHAVRVSDVLAEVDRITSGGNLRAAS